MDPAASPVAEFAFALRKLRQEAGGPTYAAMARRSPYSVATLSRAAAGEQLPTLAVALAYVTVCGGDLEDFEARWRLVADRSTTSDALDAEEGGEPSPYRGLARFEPGDRELFFGRDRVLADLVALLHDHRVVTVFGTSGSGKSSVLRAGLIPYLSDPDGALPRPAAIRILTPGEHPLTAHRAALGAADAEGDTWLIVDQFEELFTLCHDIEERAAFTEALLGAADPARRLRVVLGVRADFYARCLEHPGLAQAVGEASLPVGRMTPAELRQVIVKPAAAHGLIVERTLTQTLIEEASAQTSALPMLSHALLEVWRRRRARTLTLEAYERAGGVRGAIAQTAEAAFTRMDTAQGETVRRIMLRLITPGDGLPDTRRPTTRTELGALGTDGRTNAVLELLARERLVTLDEDRVDLAHEALITGWPRLHGWIEQDRDKLRLHRWLTDAAGAWDSAGRDRGVRISPNHLSQLTEFTTQPGRGELTRLESDFLDACTATQQRTKRNRRAVRTVIALLSAVAILAATAAWQQNKGEDQRRLQNAALRTAALADRLRPNDPETAARLAVASWDLSQTTETRATLLGAQTHLQEPDFTPVDEESAGYEALLGRDAKTLTFQKDDRLEQWDIPTRQRTSSYVLPEAPAAMPNQDPNLTRHAGWLNLSPDGKRAVAARAAEQRRDTVLPGEVHVWDLASGERRPLKPVGPSGAFNSMSWAADSSKLAWNVDGTVELWDTVSARRLFSVEGHKDARAAAVSPDASRIALCGTDGLVQVWSVAERRRIQPNGEDTLPVDPQECDGAGRLEFAPNGNLLAVRLDSGLRVTAIDSGRSWLFPENGLTEFAFSADSTFIGALKRDALFVWRTEPPHPGMAIGGGPVFTLDLPNDEPSQLALDIEHGLLRYMRADSRTVATVDIGALREQAWSAQQQEPEYVSTDGRYAVRGRRKADAFHLDLYDLRTGAHLAALPPLPNERGELPSAGFSPDGRLFAYGPSSWATESSPVRLYDIDQRRAISEYTLPERELSPDGLAPFLIDGKPTVYAVNRSGLWELASGRHLTDVSLLSEALAVHPDASLAVLGDGAVIGLPTGKVIRKLTAGGTLISAAFSPDGRILTTTDQNGRVTLWNSRAERIVGAFSPDRESGSSARSSPITALGYSPDSRTLATGDQLGRVRLWDIASLRPLGGPFPTPGDPLQHVAFSEDGHTLRTQGDYTPVRTHTVDPTDIAAALCTRFGGQLTRTQWRDHIPDVPFRSTCR